jgi:hypothetical protein
MTKTLELELVPNQKKLAKLVFKNQEEYEKFRRSFYNEVKPSLDKWAEARQRSEEEAKRRWYH